MWDRESKNDYGRLRIGAPVRLLIIAGVSLGHASYLRYLLAFVRCGSAGLQTNN